MCETYVRYLDIPGFYRDWTIKFQYNWTFIVSIQLLLFHTQLQQILVSEGMAHHDCDIIIIIVFIIVIIIVVVVIAVI